MNVNQQIIRTEPGRSKRWFYDRSSGEISQRLFDLTLGKEIDPEGLVWYLTLGFVPGERTLFKDIVCLPGGYKIEIFEGKINILEKWAYSDFLTDQYFDVSEEKLIDEGIYQWKTAISSAQQKASGDIIVPISSGLDSRAILAALLEHHSASEIFTYTYGPPDTWDYEIGNRIAKITGTKHISYDTTKFNYTLQGLEKTADLTDGSSHSYKPYPIEWINKNFGITNITHWTGHVGGALTGIHFPRDNSPIKDEDFCIQSNRFVRDSKMEEIIFGPNILDRYKLPYTQSIPLNGVITPEEIWDLNNRQELNNGPFIMFRGPNFVMPFIEPSWLKFIMSVPRHYRQNQILYKKIILKAFPKLFSLPSGRVYGKSLRTHLYPNIISKLHMKARKQMDRSLPGQINRKNKSAWLRIKYLDFDLAFKNNQNNFRHAIMHNVKSLSKRALLPKTQLNNLLGMVQENNMLSPDALLLLSSLELNLKLSGANI
ncbi:hypothetical protein ACFLZW_00585 [Chloroflexota bacterium]